MSPPAPGSPRPVAVVIGADCMTGLQTARILRAHGIEVVGIAEDRDSPFTRSRAFGRLAFVGRDDAETCAIVEHLAGSGAPPVLFPCTDDAVRLIDRRRERLAACSRFALPPSRVLHALADKSQSAALAERHGVPLPRTAILHERSDVEAASRSLRFPCVLKPPERTREWLDATGVKVVKVEDTEELLRVYERVADLVPCLVLQEYVPGGDDAMFSVYTYLDPHSEPLGHIVLHKLRQWPPLTGSGSLAVEDEREGAVSAALALLRGAGHRGLASVQLKRHPETGVFYFIEANIGRPILNGSLAEACGLEILHTIYCELAGLPLPDAAVRRVRHPGVRWISWKMDLASAWWYFRRGELTPAEWWRSVRGRKTCAVWSPSDPLPFLLDMGRKLVALPRRLARGSAAERLRAGDAAAPASRHP